MALRISRRWFRNELDNDLESEQDTVASALLKSSNLAYLQQIGSVRRDPSFSKPTP